MVLPLVVSVALAAPVESWSFKWKAPKGCIEPAQLARAVEAQLGHAVFGAGAKNRIDGELTSSPQAPRWRAKLISVDGDGNVLGSREVSSDEPGCRSLDDKLALVVAVMIDPKRSGASDPEPAAPAPAPAPAPPPAASRQSDVPRAVDRAAVEEYEKKVIHFGDWLAINPQGAVVARGTQPFQGKYLKPLTPVEFYREIGETERVEVLETRGKVKSALMIPGIGLLGTGLVGMLAGIFIAGDCPLPSLTQTTQVQFQACLQRRNDIRNGSLILGVGAMVLGAVLAVAGIVVPYPVDESPVMREKADAHNRRLRHGLGLDGADEEAPLPNVLPPNAQAMR